MKMRVIIVDDDSRLLETASNVFSAAGIDFICAPGEYEAAAALSGPPPSHIILEVENDRIEVLDFLNRVAAIPDRPALILVTRHDARLLEAAKQTALNKGFRIVSVARKPVSARQLSALLASARDASMDAPTLHGSSSAVAGRDIQDAIRLDRFQLVYQPRIDCRRGALSGFEALARWDDVPPRDFIRTAEEIGLMRTLTRRLTAKGIRWLSTHFPHDRYTLSINLSPGSLADVGFPEYVADSCRHFHLDPARIVLELTEPAVIGSVALEQVTRLRLKGFGVALDDAGTVRSSLEQLLKLPFSEMEIDRTFVRRVAGSEECRKIVNAMIRMGHRLELAVTGKGVETEESFAYLVDHGCDYAQGFYVAPPLEPAAAARWHPSA